MSVTEDRPSDRHGVRRWRVHLALIASLGLALLAVAMRTGLSVHIVAGLCFAGLVGAHLAQRRRTVRTLVPDLTRPARWRTLRGRLALSDAVLVFLAANVVVSGVVDWITGRSLMVPVHALTGLPLPSLNWHTTTSLVLVVYLVVHVVRRRARLRHSQIR
jgi:hypothetical protein